MLDKSHIEDTIVKFKGYRIIVTDTKDLVYAKRGDMISSESIFFFNMYLEMYLSILEYSLTWFDNTDTYREDDAPISLDEINTVINRGNELITVLINTPLNA